MPTLDSKPRIKLLEQSLTRAADVLGDLTPPVMKQYYARYPEAKQAFEHHGLGKRERLEADMMDNVLYSLMTWLERPVEVSIMLYGSVPHHSRTLHVQPDWYQGLLNTAIDLIKETIPETVGGEIKLLNEIQSGLQGAISETLGTISTAG
jgi:hypothetical protein